LRQFHTAHYGEVLDDESKAAGTRAVVENGQKADGRGRA